MTQPFWKMALAMQLATAANILNTAAVILITDPPKPRKKPYHPMATDTHLPEESPYREIWPGLDYEGE